MRAEPAIRELVDELIRAWNSRDWVSFSRLFAEEADYVTGSGVRLAGRSSIHDALFTRDVDHGQVTVAIESIRILAADAAVILCTWRMGSPTTRVGVMTLVTQHRGDTWQIITLQNTDTVG